MSSQNKSQNITAENVKKYAKLVKLDVTGDEEKLAKMMTETVDFISILDELDTSKVDATFQITGAHNIFQQTDNDAEPKTLKAELALSNANTSSKNLFETVAVFDR